MSEQPLVATSLRAYLTLIEDFAKRTKTVFGGEPEYRYATMEGFVAANGREYPSQVLTDAEWEILTTALRRGFHRRVGHLPEIKECFFNAQNLVAHDFSGTLKYVEGYCSGVIAVHHGWVDCHGKVIDVTIRPHAPEDPEWVAPRDHRSPKPWPTWNLGRRAEAREYVGVVFPDLLDIVTRHQYIGASLIDNWKENWPLLRGEARYGFAPPPIEKWEPDAAT